MRISAIVFRRTIWALACCLAPGLPASADDAAPDRVHGAGRVVAIGDVHGAYAEFSALLQQIGLVDSSLHWNGASTHLVSLGDLTDRGPDSRRVLDLLMRLEAEARKAGGAVHVLLGNHEVMNLSGDLRDVSAAEVVAFAADEDDDLRRRRSEEYVARAVAAGQAPEVAAADFERRFPRGWFAKRAAFAADGRYGSWLLARPALLQIDDSLFAHAGLSRVVTGYDLSRLNATFRAELRRYVEAVATLEAARWFAFEDSTDARAAIARQRGAVEVDPALADAAKRVLAFEVSPLFGIQGPVWYRGLAICHPLPQTDVLDSVLAHFGARRLVVGHTVTRDARIVTRFDGRVITLDTGMLKSVYNGRASALEITAQGLRALYADGSSAAPGADPRPLGFATFAQPDAQREQWLRGATVRSVAPADAPRRTAELEFEGKAIHALFLPDAAPARGPRARWANELAAYQLDRLLGLYLVQTSVQRDIGGKPGALQWREPGSVSAADPASRTPTTTPWCDLAQQYELLNAFDALTFNQGRTLDSIEYSADEWLVLSIDHRYAFGTGRGLPPHLQQWATPVGPAACRRFAALDKAGLTAALGAWLKPNQIGALLARRDRLLKPYAAKGGFNCGGPTGPSSGSPAGR